MWHDQKCQMGDRPVTPSRAMRWVDDPGLWLMISLALVTGTYRLADVIGVSGPTAVVACGLILCLQGPREGEDSAMIPTITQFWSVVEELINAMLFVLIGFELFAINLARVIFLPVVGALPLALVSRLVGVALPLLALRGGGDRQRRGMAVLTWTGLRGGVSIALALTLPDSPYRGRLLVVCYTVVVGSMLVQELTMPLLFRQLYGENSKASGSAP